MLNWFTVTFIFSFYLSQYASNIISVNSCNFVQYFWQQQQHKKKIHPSQLNLAYDTEKQTLEAMSIYRLLGQYEDHNCPLKS